LALIAYSSARFVPPSNLRVLQRVVLGFSEDARTRGFPSPPLGGFGFVKYENFITNLVQIGELSICRNRDTDSN